MGEGGGSRRELHVKLNSSQKWELVSGQIIVYGSIKTLLSPNFIFIENHIESDFSDVGYWRQRIKLLGRKLKDLSRGMTTIRRLPQCTEVVQTNYIYEDRCEQHHTQSKVSSINLQSASMVGIYNSSWKRRVRSTTVARQQSNRCLISWNNGIPLKFKVSLSMFLKNNPALRHQPITIDTPGMIWRLREVRECLAMLLLKGSGSACQPSVFRYMKSNITAREDREWNDLMNRINWRAEHFCNERRSSCRTERESKARDKKTSSRFKSRWQILTDLRFGASYGRNKGDNRMNALLCPGRMSRWLMNLLRYFVFRSVPTTCTMCWGRRTRWWNRCIWARLSHALQTSVHAKRVLCLKQLQRSGIRSALIQSMIYSQTSVGSWGPKKGSVLNLCEICQDSAESIVVRQLLFRSNGLEECLPVEICGDSIIRITNPDMVFGYGDTCDWTVCEGIPRRHHITTVRTANSHSETKTCPQVTSPGI